MGHVPDWARKNHAKVMKMSDGGDVEGFEDKPSQAPFSVTAGGSSFQQGPVSGVGGGGRIGFKKMLDKDSDVEVGVRGNYSRVKVADKNIEKASISGADLTYRKKDDSFSVAYDEGPGQDGKLAKRVMFNYRKSF